MPEPLTVLLLASRTTAGRKTIGAVSAAIVVLLALMFLAVIGVISGQQAAAPVATDCAPSKVVTVGSATPDWWNTGGKGAERSKNAAAIIAVADEMKLPERAKIIGLATGIQESKLLPLADDSTHPGIDAYGVFQQRPSQGWGTKAQVLDTRHAARSFYTRLVKVKGWETMRLGDAAEAVQISGLPRNYDTWESLSTQLVRSAKSGDVAYDTCGTGGGAQVVAGLPADASKHWSKPTKAAYVNTSPFGWRTFRGVPNFHKGQDLALPVGNPVTSICDGVVTRAQPMDPYGGGNQIHVNCGGGVQSIYMHNSAFVAKVGQKVKAGDLIAQSGTTGNSSGPHIHLQIEVNTKEGSVYGVAIDPVPFLRARGITI